MLQRSLFQSRAWNAESLGPVGGILRLTPNRIIPSVGVNGRGRFTMGLRRLESVPHQPGFLIVL